MNVYYCGCRERVGHFVYESSSSWRSYRSPTSARTTPPECPWKHLDSSKLTPPGSRIQGNAVLRHKDGWTVLSIHDFTVDKRPGSHSTFATAETLDFDQMYEAAKAAWPSIIERVGPLRLVEDV